MSEGRAGGRSECRAARALDGVLLLDKPIGVSSQQAVTQVKRLLDARKAGHTGTLDPMASGLLPVCIGEATKFSQLLIDADKTYQAHIRLGITTTTGDLEGEPISTAPVSVTRPAVERVLQGFLGEICQVPPMYSAVKHAGRPLYKYARAGVEIPRLARKITLHQIDLDSFAGNELQITVKCSKGTYIRVLAEDIGRELGCGATLAGLRRVAAGAFSIGGALGLDVLSEMSLQEREQRLLPVEALVVALPRVDLDAFQSQRILTGQVIEGFGQKMPGLVRIYGPGSAYLGIAALGPLGTMAPQRLMTRASEK